MFVVDVVDESEIKLFTNKMCFRAYIPLECNDFGEYEMQSINILKKKCLKKWIECGKTRVCGGHRMSSVI